MGDLRENGTVTHHRSGGTQRIRRDERPVCASQRERGDDAGGRRLSADRSSIQDFGVHVVRQDQMRPRPDAGGILRRDFDIPPLTGVFSVGCPHSASSDISPPVL